MNEVNLSSGIDDYIAKRQEAKPGKWPSKADWLDDAANRAKQITLVTHAPKFTHGDARGEGARVAVASIHSDYLSTASLGHGELDVIGNAAALDVANFLLLNVSGQRLADMIQKGDLSALVPFAKTPLQLDSWLEGFAMALQGGGAVTHTLAKQTYFPITAGQYHLLSPLFASTLYHVVHQRIDHSRFSEAAKMARECRRNGLFSDEPVVVFPNLAEQHFGGTKPQNVSLLNSKRGGRAYLMSCQPPQWQSVLNHPLSEAHFWQQYGYEARATTRELIAFLRSAIKQHNNNAIKRHRAELVSELTTHLHNHAARVRTLPAGWSQQLEEPMSAAFSFWLDPGIHHAPPANWCEYVSQAFGQWLNKQLQKQLAHIGDAELNVWRQQVVRELRLLKHDLEAVS